MEESYVRTLEDSNRQFQELNLSFCGYSICQPGHSFGPAVRPVYILHYVLNGKGQYQVGSRTYYLEKEQGFLIEPNVMTYYQADDVDPWSYLWIGFEGKCAEEILKKLGLKQRMLTFEGQCGAQLLEIVKDILLCEAEGMELDFIIQAQLQRFFAYLAHDLSRNGHIFRPEQQNYYVRTAIEFIQEHYDKNIKIRDIAEHVGISRNYMSTLFQSILQVSPNEYLANFRLTRAKELLTITDLSIGMISSRCGYRDPLVFSKAFKLKWA